MAIKFVRLELARDHDFPEGSHNHGYEMIAPIDADGYLSLEEWQKARSKCRVKRFWAGETTELGQLIHRQDDVWAFDYDPTEESDDEPGFKLGKHKFEVGEYVSFAEHDGHERTFRVVEVRDASDVAA